jgi:hypothetical protein
MYSSRMGSLSRRDRRRLAAWTALAIGWVLPTTGCQVEYAGMTLPSGKYMHDDVQFFPTGPSFPWANTQAATQRAKMQMMGIEPGPVPGAGGAFPPPAEPVDPRQRAGGGVDVNTDPRESDTKPPPDAPVPAPPPAVAPGVAPPGGGVPAPGGGVP